MSTHRLAVTASTAAEGDHDTDRDAAVLRRTGLQPAARGLSLVGGLGLLAAGWRALNRVAVGTGLIAGGAYLLYRAVTGRCCLSEAFRRERARRADVTVDIDVDEEAREARVDEASIESFPASDPPAWTH